MRDLDEVSSGLARMTILQGDMKYMFYPTQLRRLLNGECVNDAGLLQNRNSTLSAQFCSQSFPLVLRKRVTTLNVSDH